MVKSSKRGGRSRHVKSRGRNVKKYGKRSRSNVSREKRKKRKYRTRRILKGGAEPPAGADDDAGAHAVAAATAATASLYFAANSGDEIAMATMLDVPGVDVNAPNSYGLYPLHIAVRGGHKNIVDMLLSHPGINIEVTMTPHQQTPLHLAIQNGHQDIVNRLVTKGANKTATDIRGNTPLHYTAIYNRVEIVDLLSGVDYNSKNIEGMTPLHFAADKTDTAIIKKLLLDPSIDMDATTFAEQRTPLHFAALSEANNAYILLIERGAATDETDSHGYNANFYWEHRHVATSS